MVQLRNHSLCRDLCSCSSHSVLERQYLRESNVNDLPALLSHVGRNLETNHDLGQPAVWIAIIIVLIFAFNLITVEVFGEAEFIFASIKILTIVGLIILALVLDLGGGPTHDRLGFRLVCDHHKLSID